MKRRQLPKMLLGFFKLVFLLIFISSCGGNEDDSSGGLKGNWMLSSILLKSDISETELTFNSSSTISFSFNSSGSYTFNRNEIEESGSYSLDSENNILTITNSQGTTEFEIVSFSESELTYVAASINTNATLTQETADILHFASLNFISRGQDLSDELSRSENFVVMFSLKKI